MNINLSAIIAEIFPNRSRCGVIIASTALACMFYAKKRQESRGRQVDSEDNNNDMKSFVKNSQTVLKLISESSFSSDIDLSCLSDYQDLSALDTTCQPLYEELCQSYCDDSFIAYSGSQNNLEFWRLTNISTCEADNQIINDSHYHGLFQTEDQEIF